MPVSASSCPAASHTTMAPRSASAPSSWTMLNSAAQEQPPTPWDDLCSPPNMHAGVYGGCLEAQQQHYAASFPTAHAAMMMRQTTASACDLQTAEIAAAQQRSQLKRFSSMIMQQERAPLGCNEGPGSGLHYHEERPAKRSASGSCTAPQQQACNGE